MTTSNADQGSDGVDRRLALAREWDEIVAEVRRLDGFEDFLRPPRLETLLPAAEGGPVVILNISRWRCDALIVQRSGVDVVELPDLTRQDVVQQTQSYLEAVGARQRSTLRGTFHRESHRDMIADLPDDDAEVETALDTCLGWMWDSFAAKVLDHLGHTNVPTGEQWPRVWWCPTGPLTLLPIHAAGHHREGGAAVLDRVVSSYTPTLRALVEARRSAQAESSALGGMLFVGMPTTPEQADLPNVTIERELLERLFTDRLTSLVGPAATREAVLGELLKHSWVHFACHGEQNLDDPSCGGVLVQDGLLTVTGLSSQQYRGEFAYLSGCKTAVGGVHLPDEAITLAAAMHFTGFRHVIATLWSVWDAEAAQVAGHLYGVLVHDGVLNADGAAQALHTAVRTLRAANRDRPSVWTPFAHIGP